MSCPRIIDLSQPLDDRTPVYPGDTGVAIEVLETTQDPPKGRRSLNCSGLRFGVHNGTHMDAPFHFFDNRTTIDQVDLAVCTGPALLVDLTHLGPGDEIDVACLSPFQATLRETKRVVLHTGWSRSWGAREYFTDHPVITGAAARLLVDCGVSLVGVDTPSVDLPPFPAHLELLGNGVLIVENLTNLSAIQQSVFHLTAIPLKITGRDASPVRAIAMEK